eukprot:GHVT01104586.1.p1 GENE.GHVT01104586.1~~GHVT01104586.1.p1  ORF type:complete len:113 (+),score=9.19 GHVT01104586.1:696-1034(+)
MAVWTIEEQQQTALFETNLHSAQLTRPAIGTTGASVGNGDDAESENSKDDPAADRLHSTSGILDKEALQSQGYSDGSTQTQDGGSAVPLNVHETIHPEHNVQVKHILLMDAS